jgi:uncharacterized repeat protein (TIGR04052 family)
VLNVRNSLVTAAAVASLFSCGTPSGNDAGTDTEADAGVQGQAVEVKFKVAIAGQPFSCSQTYNDIGSNPDAGLRVFRPADARFYVHDVALTDSSGAAVPVTMTNDGVWQNDGVALIDAEDFTGTCLIGNPGTNLKVVGTVPEGTYTGLKLKVGVPAERNHLYVDAQPSPLNFTPMFWTWTTGYRFMRIEGTDGEGKGLPGGLLHLGSTVCKATDSADPRKGAACVNTNVVNVAFDTFDTSANTVAIDLAHLFKDTDTAINQGGSGGCMSGPDDPECPAMFEKLGLPLMRGDGGSTYLPDGGAYVAGPQTLFTKE